MLLGPPVLEFFLGYCLQGLGFGVVHPEPYLEGQGDLVSRSIMGIIRVTKWVIGVIILLTKSA